MNDQTTQLIRELAEKLGTTTEHLWGVLVRQAPISASADILICAVLLALVFLTGRWSIGKARKLRDTEAKDPSFNAGGYVVAVALLVVWGVLSFIAVMIVASGLEGILAGFLNPEYWALKQILP